MSGCDPRSEKYFFWENKLSMDKCALAAKQTDSDLIYDYNTFNFFLQGDDCEKVHNRISCFAENYPNLRFRDGYGVGECKIDTDSKLRYEPLTHGREHQQLNTRLFYAVPNFARGGLVTNVETVLKNATDTKILHKECDKLAEKDFDRFVDLLNCGKNAYTQPYTLSAGEDSRQIWRQHLRSCTRG